jgi:hypothetical protein
MKQPDLPYSINADVIGGGWRWLGQGGSNSRQIVHIKLTRLAQGTTHTDTVPHHCRDVTV